MISKNLKNIQNKEKILPIIKGIILLVICFPLLGLSKESVRTYQSANLTEVDSRPPLYLPDIKYVRLATLGYDSLASKILWFNTINYFGRQFAKRKDLRWLGDMCKLVTNLDPKATHVFEFCATLLSWIAKEPEKSVALLSDGINFNPDYWRYRYMRGFNYWYFLERFDLAKEDFLAASKIADTPAFVKILASRLLVNQDSPLTAIEFLQEEIKRTPDPLVRENLIEKQRQAKLSYAFDVLNKKIELFSSQQGRMPTELRELIKLGYLKELPTEPWGGNFYINELGQVESTSGKKPLRFRGNTASSSANDSQNSKGQNE